MFTFKLCLLSAVCLFICLFTDHVVEDGDEEDGDEEEHGEVGELLAQEVGVHTVHPVVGE